MQEIRHRKTRKLVPTPA